LSKFGIFVDNDKRENVPGIIDKLSFRNRNERRIVHAGKWCVFNDKGAIVDEAAIREKLRAYITCDLIRDANYNLTDTEGIITNGLMDSFALAEFAVYVEQEFGVYIPDPDLTVEKMNTLDQMVARVMRDMQ